MKLADVNTVFGFWPKRKLDISIKRLLHEMDRHQVCTALTCSVRGLLYNHEEGNDETLRECKQDARLVPAATIDPRRYPGKKGYVKALAEQGFRALRLFPEQQGWPINYAPMRAIAAEAAQVKMPVVISHRGLGSLTEISDLFQGTGTPIVLARVNYDAVAEAVAVAASNPLIHIETSLVDTPDGFPVFVREMGPDRLLFGSYAPFHYLGAALKVLQKAEIPEAARAKIACSNFIRLFGRTS